MLTKGPGRFEYWLVKLDEKLAKAKDADNPALFLYQNDARTVLFMLEELSQLYAQLHNKKRFEKLRSRFKEVEDLIGQIDYYDFFAKDFFADPLMPATVRIAMETRRDESVAALNRILQKRGWLNGKRRKKIRRRLRKANWMSPSAETGGIIKVYAKSAESITVFFSEAGERFTDVEEQVHALRRKLRRLSIYPQALQGAVQFMHTEADDPVAKKYQTPEIVQSKFNVMPDAGNNDIFVGLNRQYYFALSWLIAKLGGIKDKGLRIIAAREGFAKSQFINDDVALAKVYELTGTRMEDILEEAMQVSKPFFEEKNLEKLIY